MTDPAAYYACSPVDGLENTGKWHDWRLWEREPITVKKTPAWRETWYCTRCRKIEERTVDA